MVAPSTTLFAPPAPAPLTGTEAAALPCLERTIIEPSLSSRPDRAAWVEIDLGRLRRNLQIIHQDKPAHLKILSVVKDSGYGHGALAVAQAGAEFGVNWLALVTVEEAMELRDAGVKARLLLLGDRHESELSWCVAHQLTCTVTEPSMVRTLGELARLAGRRVPVHVKINTGMNRYGVRWTEAAELIELVHATPGLVLEGALTHFAQSDETDKTFANLQISRFTEVMNQVGARGIQVPVRHLCNSGGFLDLPHAHGEMVRLGILPLGIFPSRACRRLPGILPVMSVRARIAAIQWLDPGDCVGYGMRYTAAGPRRIAVIPVGYGDGFPRVRNDGCALIAGKRAPLVGGVAMDALTVDITDIPEARLWDEAVLMGQQGDEEISVHEVARLKNTVSYDVLTSWRSRLPRVYVP